jgi:hypothetical protein
MIFFFYAQDFTLFCINTMLFLLLGVGPYPIGNNYKKQARFETPKFIQICNCIEMIRKKITWLEGVTNYNH